jgi:hypothetical protein
VKKQQFSQTTPRTTTKVMNSTQEQRGIDDQLRSVFTRVKNFMTNYKSEQLVQLVNDLGGKMPRSRTKRNLAIALVEVEDEDKRIGGEDIEPIDYKGLLKLLSDDEKASSSDRRKAPSATLGKEKAKREWRKMMPKTSRVPTLTSERPVLGLDHQTRTLTKELIPTVGQRDLLQATR